MATTISYNVTFGYANLTTRTYRISGLEQSEVDIEDMRTKVQELNKVFGGETSTLAGANSYGADMPDTFVASDGSKLTQITKLQLQNVEEEVIYSG